MSLITRMRKQRATWWESIGIDNYGQKTYADPVEIWCRWEDVLIEVILANNEKVTAKTTVYVDREMKVGDYLKYGLLDEETGTGEIYGDPTTLTGAFEIIRFEKLPNLRNTEYLLTAYL